MLTECRYSRLAKNYTVIISSKSCPSSASSSPSSSRRWLCTIATGCPASSPHSSSSTKTNNQSSNPILTYGCQTLLSSHIQIPPRSHRIRTPYLPARWINSLLAGLAADEHLVCADVSGRTTIDDEEP